MGDRDPVSHDDPADVHRAQLVRDSVRYEGSDRGVDRFGNTEAWRCERALDCAQDSCEGPGDAREDIGELVWRGAYSKCEEHRRR